MNKNFFIILPVLAFIFYGFFWNDVNMIHPDTIGYTSTASDISDWKIDQLNFRTPGYPLLLLFTGSSQQPTSLLFFIQLLMYILSVIALSWMLLKLDLSKKLILLFIFLALLPFNVAKVTFAATESLTVFTLVFGLFFLFKWFIRGNFLQLGLSAILFSYAAIVRPTYQLILFVFVFIFILIYPYLKVYKKKFISLIITVGVSSLIIIGSLFYVNYTKFNYKGLTPIIGFNLCNKTVAVIERLPNEYDKVKGILIKYRDKQLIEENSSHKGYNYIWDKGAIPELKEATNLGIADLSNYMKELNLNLIINSPRAYLKEVSSAISIYWLPNIVSESLFGSNVLLLIFIIIHFLLIGSFFLLIFMFGFLFVPKLYRDEYKFINEKDEFFLIIITIPLVIIFYTMFISVLVESGNPRFRTVNDLFILFSMFTIFSFLKGKIAKNKNI